MRLKQTPPLRHNELINIGANITHFISFWYKPLKKIVIWSYQYEGPCVVATTAFQQHSRARPRSLSVKVTIHDACPNTTMFAIGTRVQQAIRVPDRCHSIIRILWKEHLLNHFRIQEPSRNFTNNINYFTDFNEISHAKAQAIQYNQICDNPHSADEFYHFWYWSYICYTLNQMHKHWYGFGRLSTIII